MSELDNNVIISIVDTLDGPEELVLNLDEVSLEDLREMIPQFPDLLPYLVQRTLDEFKGNDSQ